MFCQFTVLLISVIKNFGRKLKGSVHMLVVRKTAMTCLSELRRRLLDTTVILQIQSCAIVTEINGILQPGGQTKNIE